MTREEIGVGVGVTIIRAGFTNRGRYLGLIMIPPGGGWEWHAANSRWGQRYNRARGDRGYLQSASLQRAAAVEKRPMRGRAAQRKRRLLTPGKADYGQIGAIRIERR